MQQWRGREYKIDFLPKIKIELVVVNDEKLEAILNTIAENARIGEVGDGKIFVSSIDDVVRIRTGESGREAV